MLEQQIPTYRSPSLIRSYAWLIAIIGLLVLIVSGIIYLLFKHSWASHAEVGLGVGAVLLLGAVLLRPDVVRTFLAGRPVKYASNALVMSLSFVSIIGLINFLAIRNDVELDLTENHQFTLSPQTVQILGNLDRPVQVIGFFQTGDPRQYLAQDLLERLSDYTTFLSYEFHDPNVEPTLAQSYELSNYGLLFVSGSRRSEVHTVSEDAVTSGLIRVTSDQEKRILFTTGHGEPSIVDSAPEGLSKVREALEQENYIVETVNLAALSETLPKESTTLVLAGAERELLEREVTFLTDWVKEGGKLMILVDPLDASPLPDVLAKYGITLGDDLVADSENHIYGFAPTSPIIVKYPFHEITQGLDGSLTFFPLARSLSLVDLPPDLPYEVSPILTTGPNSWAETDVKARTLEYNQDTDKSGPIHIGVVAEDLELGTRLVVFGSTDFINNQVLDEVANRDLFMNAVNWVTEEEDLISIRPKDEPNRRVFLTPMQHTMTILTALIFIPAVVFSAGVAMWWTRR
ncbi:MAG: GldG family protein [Anaerolineae bacterium]|nr:GldG family protein [Anaerolineae bacterium]